MKSLFDNDDSVEATPKNIIEIKIALVPSKPFEFEKCNEPEKWNHEQVLSGYFH